MGWKELLQGDRENKHVADAAGIVLGAGVPRGQGGVGVGGALLPGSRGTDPYLSADSVFPRPTLGWSCGSSVWSPPHPPYPLDTFRSLPFPLFREPVPSDFWKPHVPCPEG